MPAPGVRVARSTRHGDHRHATRADGAQIAPWTWTLPAIAVISIELEHVGRLLNDRGTRQPRSTSGAAHGEPQQDVPKRHAANFRPRFRKGRHAIRRPYLAEPVSSVSARCRQ